MRKQKLIWNLRDGSQSQACTIRELKINNVHTERNMIERIMRYVLLLNIKNLRWRFSTKHAVSKAKKKAAHVFTFAALSQFSCCDYSNFKATLFPRYSPTRRDR